MAKKKTEHREEANQHILNIITPAGIDYDKNFANVGENVGKIFALTKYPTDGVSYGWLADLCNIEGTSTIIEYRTTEPSRLTSVFNKKINELKSDQELLKQESEKQQNEQAIKDLEEMIHRIAVRNEPVGYLNIMLHVQDVTISGLQNRIKRVNSIVAISGCNMRNLKYKQFQALQCISPYGRPNREVSNIGDRNMPISSFVGGFPMSNPGINDEDGYYIGKTKNNRLIILNQWMRNKDRVNSNWFITGMPGVGKSSFLKSLFIREIAFGTKFIVFDPEKEYQDLARHPDVEGDIIDCAGGSTGRINPLQIRVSPRVTKEDIGEGEDERDYFEYDEEYGVSDLALHIQNLRTFFKLYFGADAFDSGIKTALEECLIEMYRKFGITWETDIGNLEPEDYPILTDLYETVEEMAKREGLSEYKRSVYDKLKDLLFSVAKGADQQMWNGPTTIQAKSKFVVLDMSKLLEVDENVKRAQFMNITMWAWQQMSYDRTEKVLLGVDEGYLFVEPEYPDLGRFLRNISKRDRKYEAGLLFITHSVVDLLDPAVKRLGQAIIDNACYKFIMGCDGKNLEETKKLFNLSEKEENILAAKNRGQGILYAGSVRIDAQIDIREEFMEMFGKAGGR